VVRTSHDHDLQRVERIRCCQICGHRWKTSERSEDETRTLDRLTRAAARRIIEVTRGAGVSDI
jgi:hypothetical protein